MRSAAARWAPDLPLARQTSFGRERRTFAHPAPIRSIGFLARSRRHDICVDAVLELAGLIGRLPSCIDLLEPAPHRAMHRDLDLVLISRSPSEPICERHRRAGDAVLQSGAPVLLLPRRPSRHRLAGERALIIWDGSLSAISALRGAALLLQHAREIMLVDAIQGEPRASVDTAMAFLEALPGQRMLDTTRLHLDSKPLVLETALLTGADFLVMGGFGQWNALPDVVYGDSDSPFPRARLALLLGQ